MNKKYISNLVTLGFLILFVWYVLAHQSTFKALEHVAIWALLLVAAGKMLVFISNGLFTKWTAEAFTKKFTFGEGIYITILSAIGNFFGPLLGGASIRAVYLKKYHNLTYSKFTSTLMGYYLMLFMANSLLAVVSLLFLTKTHQTIFLIIFFTVWFFVLAGLTFVRLPGKAKLSFLTKNRFGNFIFKVLYDIEEGWQILLRDKRLLVKLAGLAFMSLAATYLISLVEFSALHISVSVPALGLYTSLVATSLLLSLTPGAIGIRETILVLVSVTIGISNQQIVQVAIIDRGVHFLLLGLLFLITRNSKLKKSLTDKNVIV